MSNVSNRHTVVPFVSGKTTPLSGQRLAKVGYKTSKNQKELKFKPIAASVPFIDDQEIIGRVHNLVPYVKTLLENTQDNIIRSLYESNDGILQSVSDEEISIDACIAFLESESNGGRLRKTDVEKWFDENVRENLFVLIADKLFSGADELTKEQEEKVEANVNAYRGTIRSE